MLRLFKVKIFVKRGVPYNLDYHQGAFLEPTTEPLLWPAAGVPWSVFQQLFRFDKLAVGFSLEKKSLTKCNKQHKKTFNSSVLQ